MTEEQAVFMGVIAILSIIAVVLLCVGLWADTEIVRLRAEIVGLFDTIDQKDREKTQAINGLLKDISKLNRDLQHSIDTQSHTLASPVREGYCGNIQTCGQHGHICLDCIPC